ncbi:MAG: hypothetical protein ACLRFJ_03520, partial [Alphaproteobacteria bacterium]
IHLRKSLSHEFVPLEYVCIAFSFTVFAVAAFTAFFWARIFSANVESLMSSESSLELVMLNCDALFSTITSSTGAGSLVVGVGVVVVTGCALTVGADCWAAAGAGDTVFVVTLGVRVTGVRVTVERCTTAQNESVVIVATAIISVQ